MHLTSDNIKTKLYISHLLYNAEVFGSAEIILHSAFCLNLPFDDGSYPGKCFY